MTPVDTTARPAASTAAPPTLPHIVIAGAPKSGTSSLHRWLADHPDICSPLADESRYLLDDDSPLRKPHGTFGSGGISGYAELFRACADAGPRARILEATPDYLYQERARTVLASLVPPPVVLFMLRRPSARVYSHYQFARNNMAVLPREVTFADFVDGAMRDEAPGGWARWNLQHVVRYSRYADYLERWIEALGRDRIRVFLFEAMAADPRSFMVEVAGEIGIDPGFYATYGFPRVKETFAVRQQWLQRVRTAIGSRTPDGAIKRAIRGWYEKANVRPAGGGPAVDERAVLERLDRAFESDNARLARLLDLDLAAWQ